MVRESSEPVVTDTEDDYWIQEVLSGITHRIDKQYLSSCSFNLRELNCLFMDSSGTTAKKPLDLDDWSANFEDKEMAEEFQMCRKGSETRIIHRNVVAMLELTNTLGKLPPGWTLLAMLQSYIRRCD
ncbi:unnamed protein product [Allacma fusca]|uniref:Uncharacterized protein n=1 Tax=Allacma fusca TaxID=39272 RepID=A0A8J2JGT5_9HEXA|nr:unnamed protein product [Allacma fusca]